MSSSKTVDRIRQNTTQLANKKIIYTVKSKQKQKTERWLKHSLELSGTAKLGKYSQWLCRLQIINTVNKYLVEFKGPICNSSSPTVL